MKNKQMNIEKNTIKVFIKNMTALMSLFYSFIFFFFVAAFTVDFWSPSFDNLSKLKQIILTLMFLSSAISFFLFYNYAVTKK